MAERLFDVQFEDEFRKLDRFLAEIPDDFQAEVMDDALTAGAKVLVRKASRPNAYFRDRTGAARSSFDFHVQVKRLRGRQRVFTDFIAGQVGAAPGGGFSAEFAPSHIAFLEFGNGRRPAIAPMRRASEEAALDGSLIRAIVGSVTGFRARKAVRQARLRSGLSP